jgi:hypothetical protein
VEKVTLVMCSNAKDDYGSYVIATHATKRVLLAEDDRDLLHFPMIN